MTFKNSLILFIFLAGFLSCGIIKDTPKYQLSDGFYKSKIFQQPAKKFTQIIEKTPFLSIMSIQKQNYPTHRCIQK